MSENKLLTEEEISKVTGGSISSAVYSFLYSKVINDEELVDMIVNLTPEQQGLLITYATNMFDNKTLLDVSANYDSYRADVVNYINQMTGVNPQ